MDEMKKWLRGQMEKKEVPDSLKPAQMEKKLEQVRQKKGGFSVYRAGLLVAAALLVAFIGVGGRLWLGSGEKAGISENSMTELAEGNASEFEDVKALGSDVTYEELYSLVKGYSETNGDRTIGYRIAKEKTASNADGASEGMENEVSYMETDSGATGASSQVSEADYSKTDLQVAGVEEGDRILTDGAYFYTVHDDGDGNRILLHILKADGDRTKEVSKMEFPSCHYSNMYLYQNQLFLIGYQESEKWKNRVGKEDGYELAENFIYRREVKTVLYVIDLSDKTKPKQKHRLTQDGYYKNSRLTGGYLYLFSVHEVSRFRTKELKKDKPETYVPCVNGEPVAENRIYAPSKKKDGSYTVMTSLALEKPSGFCDKAAIYGSFQNFYMSQNYFYLTQRNYPERFYFNYVLNDIAEESSEDAEKSIEAQGKDAKEDTKTEEEEDGKTLLLKFAYENGRFSLQAKGKFEGEVDGSYAFHEYQGNLCVIYTKYDEKTTNGLYIFDASLKKIGEIGDLGVDEEIYASYYIDHMAYFVTYRNTDPVFAVDLTDAKKPRLCSELKLPGYSDYLHSFGEDYMVGLGVHGDGEDSSKDKVKLSLFYIDEKKSLKEVAKEVTAFKTWDCELVDYDHRQVFVDEERGLLGFYVWEYEKETYYYELYQKKGEQFEKLWETEVKGVDNGYGDDLLRGVRIGETFYVVSVAGEVKTCQL